MSRHTQLPPRCPLQKKTVAPQVNASVSAFSGIDTELHSRQNGHYKITSESLILEDQPPWLNDLLNDLDLNTNSSLPDLDQLSELETTVPDDELWSSCMYGPNSPRRRTRLGFPENEIASAFSEYAAQNSPQHLDGYSSISGVQSDSYRDARASADEISADKKRHPGQRSRARKLQYISELERTVNVLQFAFRLDVKSFLKNVLDQNLGSELAVRVASLIQQHAALSLENNTLKQRLLRMKQEQLIVDKEYETLKIKVERLRSGLAVSTAANKFFSTSRSIDSAIWDMLDMRKLNLN